MARTFLTVLFILYLFMGDCWASSDSEMTVTIQEDLSVLISIDSGRPLSAEAKAIINTDEVRGIYQDQLDEIFGSAENLTLIDSSTFRMSFQSDLIISKGNRYAIERRDFGGNLEKVSVLRVNLPPGYRYVTSDEAPVEIEVNSLIWNDVNKVPEIIFEKKKEPGKNIILFLAGGLILASSLLLIKRTRR
jgi:hypothetical protein